MIRIVFAAVVVVAVISIGVTIWISGAQPVPSMADRKFFGVPQDLPIEGGQELQPRWGGTTEAIDAPTD